MIRFPVLRLTCSLLVLAASSVFAQTPKINSGGIVNAATFNQVNAVDRNLAPGVIFSIFGSSLTDGTTAAAGSTPLPTSLAGARVLINDVVAPLFYASPLQINAQFPVTLTTTSAQVRVEVQTAAGTVTSSSVTVSVGAQSPGIFTWNQTGQGPGAILRNSDFTKICPQARTDCTSNPAGLGEPIAIYMTGLGAVTGPWASGQVAETASPTVETPIVTIGGRQAVVLFSGLAAGFVGLYQLNVVVPRGISLTDTTSLQVSIGKEQLIFCPATSATECSVLPSFPPGIGPDWQFFCPPGAATRTAVCSALPPGETDLSKAVSLGPGVALWAPTSNTSTIATTNLPRSIQAGGGPPGAVITALATDPSSSATVYAGTTGGGIFKSIDGGQSWTAANSGLTDTAITAISIAPSNPQTIYAATDGSGVFKSTNGGQSWSSINTGITSRSILALGVHPSNPNTLYAGGSVLFRSTNGGQSWDTVNCDNLPSRCSSIRSIALDSTDAVYVGTAGRGLFKGTNGGGTWRDVGRGSNIGTATGTIHTLVVDPRNPATVYAASDVGVLKSTNAGLTWNVITCLGRAFGNGFCDPPVYTLAISNSTFYVATSFGVYKSTDNGGNWAPVRSNIGDATLQSSFVALAIDSTNPSVVYAGSTLGAGIFTTSDGGDHWSAINSGLTAGIVPAIAIDPVNPANVYPAVQGAGIFKSVNAGQSWGDLNSKLFIASAIAVDQTNPTTIYACCDLIFPGEGLPFRAGKTTDGGQSWASLNVSSLHSLMIDPANPSVLYGGSLSFSSLGVGGGLSKSTDAGQTWTDLTSKIPGCFGNGVIPGSNCSVFGGLAVYALSLDPRNTSTLYAATANGIVKTTDGGATWTTANGGLPKGVLQTPNISVQGFRGPPLAPTEPIQALAVDAANSSTVYAGSLRGIFKTTNGGQTWAASGLSTQVITTLLSVPANPPILYAGTQDGGVFKSTDSGQNWAGSGSPSYPVQALAVETRNPNALYAATIGGGVMKSTDGGQSWQPTGH